MFGVYGFEVWGLRSGVLGLGFGIWGLEFGAAPCTPPDGSQGAWWRVQESGLKIQGSGFTVQGSGFQVSGSGFRR